MKRIPNVYHFAFGFAADFGGIPFGLLHYLAIASCKAVNHPDEMYFYYEWEPSGVWWERSRPHLTLCKVRLAHEIFGVPIDHPAHLSDVFRLQVLLEKGGIYLDCDVVCLRPFEPLRSHALVMGEEQGVGLCNAVMLAEPGCSFLARWLNEYRSFSNENWNAHSVVLPMRLAKQCPGEVHELDHRSFFWPIHRPQAMQRFLLGRDSGICASSYCCHLWEHLFWDDYFANLTVAQIRFGDSEFCRLARPYVGEWACDESRLRFDLGGSGWRRDGFLTVGRGDYVNIHCEIDELGTFLSEDEQVNEFLVSEPLVSVTRNRRARLFRQLYRKLQPNGRVIISERAANGLSASELAGELARAGLRRPSDAVEYYMKL